MLKLKIEDIELIKLIRSKPRAGAEALYDLYSHVIFLAIIRIIPEKRIAEDLLEETYIQTWNSIGLYNTRSGSLLAWMMGIARKLARDKKELITALNI